MSTSAQPRLVCYFDGFRFEVDSVRSEGKYVDVDVWLFQVVPLLGMCACGWSGRLHLSGAEPVLAKPIQATFRYRTSTRIRFELIPADSVEVEPPRFGIDLDAILDAYECVRWASESLRGTRAENEGHAARGLAKISPALGALWASPGRKRSSLEDAVAEIAAYVDRMRDHLDCRPDPIPEGW